MTGLRDRPGGLLSPPVVRHPMARGSPWWRRHRWWWYAHNADPHVRPKAGREGWARAIPRVGLVQLHPFRLVNVFTYQGGALTGNPLCVFENATEFDTQVATRHWLRAVQSVRNHAFCPALYQRQCRGCGSSRMTTACRACRTPRPSAAAHVCRGHWKAWRWGLNRYAPGDAGAGARSGALPRGALDPDRAGADLAGARRFTRRVGAGTGARGAGHRGSASVDQGGQGTIGRAAHLPRRRAARGAANGGRDAADSPAKTASAWPMSLR